MATQWHLAGMHTTPKTHAVPTRCPACGTGMHIRRLECGACHTAVEGHFTLGRFEGLSREQWEFLELFVRVRGKIKDVEAVLGLSYPTVVSRLTELLTVMGLEGDAPPHDASKNHSAVLDDLAAGRITAAEAAARMRGTP